MSQLISVTIYKQKRSSSYYAVWRDHSGKKHKRSLRCKDRGIAKRLAAELERELALDAHGLAPVVTLDPNRTWKRTVEEFLESQKGRVRPGSVKSYEFCLNNFTNTIGDVPLLKVNTQTIETFVQKRLAGKIKPPTVNKELRSIRRLLRWAAARKYIVKVPVLRDADSGVDVWVREDVRDPKVVAPEVFDKMLAALDDPKLVLTVRSTSWWRTFLRLTHWSGCRLGELIAARWSSVDFVTGELKIASATSKGRRDKTIPLLDDMVDLLKSWHAESGNPPLDSQILPWPRKHMRLLYEEWQVIEGVARVEHHLPKHYRSSRACELIDIGEPTLVVRDWMGHSTVTTTERFYASPRKRMRAAAVNLGRAAGTTRGTTEPSSDAEST